MTEAEITDLTAKLAQAANIADSVVEALDGPANSQNRNLWAAYHAADEAAHCLRKAMRDLSRGTPDSGAEK